MYRLHFLPWEDTSAELRAECFYQLVSLLACRAASQSSVALRNGLRGGFEEMSVHIGSFNMGNYPPPPRLEQWLPRKRRHDIYVVGVQEALYGMKRVDTPTSGQAGASWVAKLVEHFGDDYALLAEHSIVHGHTGILRPQRQR